MKRWYLGLFVSVLLMFCTQIFAASIPVSLESFYADPTVTVSTDGYAASMHEDPYWVSVFLSNDPLMGGQGINTPSGLISLSFAYSFFEGEGNDDEFFAKVFDGATGTILGQFSTDTTSSGTVTWNLSGLNPGITLLGLEFQLWAWDQAMDSFVDINRIVLETQDIIPEPVPEPASMILLATGIFAGVPLLKRKVWL